MRVANEKSCSRSIRDPREGYLCRVDSTWDCTMTQTFVTRDSPFSLIFMFFQGLVGAPACGDVMKLQIKVDENGVITESKFKTFGCGSAIASSSVATEWVKGKSIDDVLQIKNADIAAHLKLPPVKLHCSMLGEDAIKAAVKDYKSKKGMTAEEAA